MHGYELHRVVAAHGELYADLKKANVYYLLDRLATDGCVLVRTEPGARGARGERLVYEITETGRQRFNALLRDVLGTFTPVHTGVDVAVAFLGMLPCAEAVELLRNRRRAVVEYRQMAGANLGEIRAPLPTVLAADHLLSIIDAELAWIDRSVKRLLADGSAGGNTCGGVDHG
jgi:DNA-binding PadR family transcriptional regulator